MRRCASSTVRRVASVGWAVRTSSTRRRAPAAWRAPSRRYPRSSSCAKASASDSRGTRPSASYSRRRRIRWCCSAMLASWKKSANARSTAAWRSSPRAATASRSASASRRVAGIAGERADPLLVVEQILPLLLDEDAPEEVAEQAHVGPESGVGGHAVSLNAAAGRARRLGRCGRRIFTPAARRRAVVVVGSGIGGISAALAGHALGLRPVVLEKSALVGGASAASGGQVWVGANHVMRRLGLDDSLEDTLRYVTALTSVDASIFEPEVARQWLASAPLVAEWLEREGVIEWEIIPGYHDYYWPTAPGACQEGRYLTGALFEGRRLGPDRERLSPPRPGPSGLPTVRCSRGAGR